MKKYFPLLILIPIFAALFICISGCGFLFCFDAASTSPEDLLANNQFVFTAYLNNVNVLADLEPVKYLGNKHHFFVIEYVLTPVEILKGDVKFKEYRFWSLVSLEIPKDFWHCPSLEESQIELIYGNELTDWNNILDIMEPEVYAPMHLLYKMMDGVRLEEERDAYETWNAILEDSIIASQILNSPELQAAFEESSKKGPIIHGTEIGMHTQLEFHYGNVMYCRVWEENGDVTWFWGYGDTSRQYLDKLRKLTGKELLVNPK